MQSTEVIEVIVPEPPMGCSLALSDRGALCTVEAVQPASRAAGAGVREGDVLLTANGQAPPIESESERALVQELRHNTAARLGVLVGCKATARREAAARAVQSDHRGEGFKVMMRLGAARTTLARRECLTREAASDGGRERLEHRLVHRLAQHIAHRASFSPRLKLPEHESLRRLPAQWDQHAACHRSGRD